MNEELVENIVLSMLAVNNYPLTKVYPLREGFRANGWLDPNKVSSWSHEEAVANLIAAGYDRGPGFNLRLADRLQELALYAREKGFDSLEKALKANDRTAVEKELLGIYGIGPAVVRNFWVLQEP
jgi:hypothetical protein